MLSFHRANLRAEWRDLCLEWTLQVDSETEADIALDSMDLFVTLEPVYDHATLHKLSLMLFKTMMRGEDKKKAKILDIFGSLPSDVWNDPSSTQLLITVGNSLLKTSSIRQMQTAFYLLQNSPLNEVIFHVKFFF